MCITNLGTRATLIPHCPLLRHCAEFFIVTPMRSSASVLGVCVSDLRCQPRRDHIPRRAVLENFAAYQQRRVTFESVKPCPRRVDVHLAMIFAKRRDFSEVVV